MARSSDVEAVLNLLSDSSPGGRSSRSGSHTELIQTLDQLIHAAEVLQPADQGIFVTTFVPWALKLLQTTGIKMIETSVEHRIRRGILEIFKIVTSIAEPMKAFLEDLMKALMQILNDDNEENAVLVIHILIDLHKVHRAALEPYAQQLIEYVLAGFDNFPEVCEIVFEAAKKEDKSQNAVHGRRGTRSDHAAQLLSAKTSFKVLIECPVMVVLLFQIHRKLVSENINRFAPQVIKALNVIIEVPPKPAPATVDLDSLEQSNPVAAAFSDYVAVQVKTLSFLAYISRGFASIIRPHYALIPTNVLRLLRDCPVDSASARKELLVATRHILSTEIRQAFVPFLEDLLNENLLLGEGYTSLYVLRPLALSMLADLVHHVRAEIKIGTLNRIIQIYSQALHDPSLPVGVQTMSAKLLVNLVDSMLVDELGSFKERRAGLLRILMALLTKFEWAANWVSDAKSRVGLAPALRQYSQFYSDPLHSRLIETDAISMDPNRDNFRDFKFLLKTLIGGVKHVLFALKTLPVHGPSSGATADTQADAFMFSIEEGKEFLSLFTNGVLTFEIFRLGDSVAASAQTEQVGSSSLLSENALNIVSLQSEEKEIYEQFAYLFTVLDPYLFQEVFSCHMEFLVKSMLVNHSLLIIPQYFLAISGISRNFAGLLIRFLMDNFDNLVSEDTNLGAIYLRLFKLLFLAVSVYPDENEAVLQPCLVEIIMNCLKRQHDHPSNRSLNYFLLLRSLFRSIGGGRFDALYKEVLPLLPVILEELGKLPSTTKDSMLQELYVELCLTTPVRLSVLLPYLSHLMKPLVLALKAGPDLISQGLRTLELCIDNLTQDFLDPIVYPVLGELLDCLWNLLRPPPANQTHSHAAMRILGKMGGRSHRYLSSFKQAPVQVESKGVKTNGIIRLSLQFPERLRIEFSVDEVILSACAVLLPSSKSTLNQQSEAFEVVSTALFILFNSLAQAPKDYTDVSIPFQSISTKLNGKRTQDAINELVQRQEKISVDFCYAILKSLFWVTSIESLSAKSRKLLIDIYVLIGTGISKSTELSSVLPGPDVFIEALISIYCGQVGGCIGQECVIEIIRQLEIVNRESSDSLVLSLIIEKLIGACYRVDSKERPGVVLLISEVCRLGLGVPWIWAYEVRLVRGLLYIMKSLPSHHGNEISDALLGFLSLCNKSPTERRASYFTQLITLLVSELSNSNSSVREAIKASFQLLSELTGSDVASLLMPLKDRLLAPIFTKPLRALPPSLQIGYIDAITYCLGLKPPLVEVNEELLRLLNEAIALSEADDSFLASKTNQIQNQANILQLRLGCIKLLSVALATSEFQLPRLQPLRNMIVAVFFKSLYSRASEVVDAARSALEQVMVHQHKLPKDLLQTALRPVLTNLAEAKRLTLPGLDGLRRVLELLTSYFKAEIGKKLLDHLAAWADPKKPLQDASSKPLCESLEVRVITAILDIFHLLPPSGHVFVADLVSVVLNLERLILRTSSSPFRAPLQRLLSHYPNESIDHLLAHMDDPAILEVYSHILSLPGSEPILNSLVVHVGKLRASLATVSSSLKPHLVSIISQIISSGSLETQVAIDAIHFVWLQVLKSNATIGDIRSCYQMTEKLLKQNPTQFQLSYLLLAISETTFMAISSNLSGTIRDSAELIVRTNDHNLIQRVFITWISQHLSKDRSTWFKVQIIRMFLLPLISLLREQPTLNSLCITTDLQAKIVESLSKSSSRSAMHDSSMLAIEEIQVVAALIQLDPSFCSEPTWNFLLSNASVADPTVKFAAFSGLISWLVAVERSRSVCSADQFLKILPNLLKMPTSETKPVVRQCLESLIKAVLNTPSTFARVSDVLSSMALGKSSHSTVLVAILWQSLIILDGADELTVELAPSLMSSYLRFAHSVFMLPESRGLSFELLQLFVKFHRRLSINQSMFEGLSSLSMKLLLSLCISADPSHDPLLASRSLEMFGSFLTTYSHPGQTLPYGCFERIFSVEPADDAQASGQRSALKLLKSLLEYRSNYLEVDLISLGPTLLLAASNSPCPDLFSLLDVFFQLMETNEAQSNVISQFENFALEGIIAGKDLLTSLCIISKSPNLQSDERIMSGLAKLFPKLSREYLSRHEQSLSSSNQDAQLDSQLHFVIIPALNLLIQSSNESFKSVALASIQLLWERCMEPKLLIHLLQLFTSWIKDEATRPFTIKDMSSVLLTPSKLDQVKDEMVMNAYFELIIAIYETGQMTGTELANRLEGSFLQGLASPNYRDRFIKVLGSHLAVEFSLRLQYLIGGIRWNLAGTYDWIPLLINLLLHDLDEKLQLVHPLGKSLVDSIGSVFLAETSNLDSLLDYIRNHSYYDTEMASRFWISIFPRIWTILAESERAGLSKALTKLLSQYENMFSIHNDESNPIYTILSGASMCSPTPEIPPHLLRFIAQHHKTWYPSLMLLESKITMAGTSDKNSLQAHCALYRDLKESDMLFGTLKRSCSLAESNAAISFAQVCKWSLSQKITEHAQEITRTGTLPYNETELCVWEDIWTEAAQKLQQWDLVTEVSKLDSNTELNMECIWRLGDWLQPDTISIAEGMLKSFSPPSTPRSTFFETFLVLNNIRESNGPDRQIPRFQSVLEEAVQGALHSWNLLPSKVSRSHTGHLHMFQMFVEIQEAMTVYAGIAGGQSNPGSLINRPQFLTDLKGLLSTWRERLPNRMDDMNVWSDLLAWRQHIFSALNAAFQANNVTAGGNVNADQTSSINQPHPFAYRGYHELAWLINKFARVCRKNGMPEVCLSFLNRIYTLPNIEIQDAFSKLKEQTQCYVDNPGELPTALEVIQATNLNYFNGIQKAEFFAMKGQILSKLGMSDEANRVFAQAVQIDLNIGKGWALWGQFNDQRFQQTFDITLAVNAINCYLQAATLHKISKARRFGARILWLLTFEDSQGSMAKSFEMYNNDLPTWFWVIFIPQLLTGLTRKEAKHVRFLLIKLAKAFPQSLYLPLRTVSEEFRMQYGSAPTAEGTSPQLSNNNQESGGHENLVGSASGQNLGSVENGRRGPTDYTDDLLAILKTGYPLLSLSMENMVEHIVQRLRSTADEDLYRVVVTLLSEAFQQMMIRFNSASEYLNGNGMETSLKRVSQMLGSSQYLSNTYKKAFDEDFDNPLLSLDQIIELLHGWKLELETLINRCPTYFSLESLSRLLAEFEFQRYDEVEVPGQYLQLKDNNSDFSRIERFEPLVEIVRRHGSSFRRIVIRASDGTAHPFVVQNPSARQARREEKLLQLFRSIRRGLKENPNSRRRGLDFSIPIVVAISAHVRLIQDQSDQVTLEEIYESYCSKNGILPDQTLLFYRDTLQSELSRLGIQLKKGNVEVLNLRVDLFQRISQKDMVPDYILKDFLHSIAPSLDELWLFRQSFTRQYAGSIFLSYVMALGHRYPHKITISQRNGSVMNTEILPTLNPNGQITLVEAVPFRLTPNLQEYMTPLVIEGVLTPAIHSYSEVFYRPDSELCEFLPVIIRDELISWVFLNQPQKPRYQVDQETGQIVFKNDLELLDQLNIDERQFLGRVIQNCELTMKRCQTLACLKETERALDCKTSAVQTILDLISCATNPQKLALMDAHWHPWF